MPSSNPDVTSELFNRVKEEVMEQSGHPMRQNYMPKVRSKIFTGALCYYGESKFLGKILLFESQAKDGAWELGKPMEDAINSWLDDNPGIEILSSETTSFGDSKTFFIFTIFYRMNQ